MAGVTSCWVVKAYMIGTFLVFLLYTPFLRLGYLLLLRLSQNGHIDNDFRFTGHLCYVDLLLV